MTYPIKIYPSQGLKLPFSLSFYPLSQTTNFGLKNLSFYPIQKLLIPKKDILLSQNFILSFGISLCTVCPRPGAAKTPKIGKSETKHARERSERAWLVADFPIFGVLDAVRAWGGGRLGHKCTRNFSPF